MANIMINGKCNLKCTYCFANNAYLESNMTIENVKTAVEFILKRNVERIGIIGGEPTLHPQLREILQYLCDNEDVKEAVLFSNGILLNNYWEELQNEKMKVLVNFNASTMMANSLYSRMLENIKAASQKYMGIERIALGLNIYDSQMDFEYIFKILETTGIKTLRLSVVVPNYSVDESNTSLEKYESMKDITYDIICEALKRGIHPHFDCNLIPKCIFSVDEKKKIIQLGGNRTNIITDRTYCSPVIDIMPDLTAVRCLGIGDSERVPIEKFKNIEDLRNYFSYKFDDYSYIMPTSDKCKNCYERIVKKCSGGCLSYKRARIEKFLEKEG
mgnify:FL=1